MTNEKFIEKKFQDMKDCKNLSGMTNSLFANGDTIYSYGYHYPLIFPIHSKNGIKYVCNTKGYSNTTSKHIAIAKGFSDLQVKLTGNVKLSGCKKNNLNLVLSLLNDQKIEIIDIMNSKNKKDTQVYKDLEQQYDTIIKAINTLN
jgi:hypothetical protein